MLANEVYDAKLAESHWWWNARRHILDGLIGTISYADKWRPLRILDVGCGTGTNLATLAKWGDVDALDSDGSALLACAPTTARMWLGNAEQLPFPKETFDVVTMLDLLEHIMIPEFALDEALEVLRPGGWLVVSVPAMPALWTEHDEQLGHFMRYEKTKLKAMIERNGFEVVACRYVFGVLLPAVYLHGKLMDALGKNPVNGNLPRWGHRLLEKLCNFESRFLDLPFGSSLFLVARKPSASSSSTPPLASSALERDG